MAFGQVYNSPTPNYVPDDDGGISRSIQGIGSAIVQGGDAIGKFGHAMKQIEKRKDATTFAYLEKLYPKWREKQKQDGNTDAFLPDNTEKDLRDFLGSEYIDEAIRANLEGDRADRWVDSSTEQWRLANEVNQIGMEQAKELNGFLHLMNLNMQEAFFGTTFDRGNVDNFMESLESQLKTFEESGVPITDKRWEAITENISLNIRANMGKVTNMADLKDLGGEFEIAGRKYSIPAHILSAIPKNKVKDQGDKLLSTQISAMGNGQEDIDPVKLKENVLKSENPKVQAQFIATSLGMGIEPLVQGANQRNLSYLLEKFNPDDPESAYSKSFKDDGSYDMDTFWNQEDQENLGIPQIVKDFREVYDQAVDGFGEEAILELWSKNSPANLYNHLRTTIKAHHDEVNSRGALTVLAENNEQVAGYIRDIRENHDNSASSEYKLVELLNEKGYDGFTKAWGTDQLIAHLQSDDISAGQALGFIEEWLHVNQSVGVAQDSIIRLLKNGDIDPKVRKGLSALAIIEGGGDLSGQDVVNILRVARVGNWEDVGDPDSQDRRTLSAFSDYRPFYLSTQYNAVSKSALLGGEDVADPMFRMIRDIAYYDHLTNKTPPKQAWRTAGNILSYNFLTISDNHSMGIPEDGILDVLSNPEGNANRFLKWAGFGTNIFATPHAKIGGLLHDSWLSSLTNIGTDYGFDGLGLRGETGNLKEHSKRDFEMLIPRDVWYDQRYSLLFALETGKKDGLPQNVEAFKNALTLANMAMRSKPGKSGWSEQFRHPYADLKIPGVDNYELGKEDNETRAEYNYRLMMAGDAKGNTVRDTYVWDGRNSRLLLKQQVFDRHGRAVGYVQYKDAEYAVDMLPVTQAAFHRTVEGRVVRMGKEAIFGGVPAMPHALPTGGISPIQPR
jgi:hypothetical protein